MNKVFWIDKKGNEISIPSINSHIGLADYFLKNSPALKEQFEDRKDKNQNIIDFLISVKGFMKGSKFDGYRSITFDSRTLSEEQRGVLPGYNEQNYKLDDIYIAELRRKRDSQQK